MSNLLFYCLLVLLAGLGALYLQLRRAKPVTQSSPDGDNVRDPRKLHVALPWLIVGRAALIAGILAVLAIFVVALLIDVGQDWLKPYLSSWLALSAAFVLTSLTLICVGLGHAIEAARKTSYDGKRHGLTRIGTDPKSVIQDELTGLANRQAIEARVAAAVSTTKEGLEHAFCHIGLDRFRIVNEAAGRAAGDAMLCEVAHVLVDSTGPNDMVARLHGDEFAVLMERCTLHQARQLAERVRSRLESLRFSSFDGVRLYSSASIGVYNIVSARESVEHTLAAADDACQLAKEKGGNRVHVLHERQLDIERRHHDVHWVSRITSAIEEDRLLLYAQPIMPTHKGISGDLRFEVLLRMRDRNGLLVTAGELLSRVERYHLAARVDRWVLEHTLVFLERAAREGQKVAGCAINISGQSLCAPGFLEFVIDTLDRSIVDTSIICFEITETALIQDLETAQNFIRVLRGWGCRFALDDFGSGLCSFAYLKNLPVDMVKIDGMFVRDVATDSVNATVVRAINDIAHSMGMLTVAEFVESEEIQSIVSTGDYRVDFVQGFAVGKPRPLDDLIRSRPRLSLVGSYH